MDDEVLWYLKVFVGLPLALTAVWIVFKWLYYAATGDWIDPGYMGPDHCGSGPTTYDC